MRIEFSPVFVFSTIVLLMYLASLLNLMAIMSYVILISGIATFGYFCLLHSGRHELKKLFVGSNKLSLILIFLLGIFLFIVIQGRHLIMYDDFSHWGTIIKEMSLTNRLPDSSSEIIIFQAYPPGSALFVYFINKFIGFTEGRMLFAQAIFMLSCLACLFAFCDSRQEQDIKTRKLKMLITSVIVLCLSIYMLGGPVSIYTLSVDTLLLLLAVTSLVAVIYYRDDILKSAIIIAPILSTLVLVKNSGIFFFVVTICFFAYAVFTTFRKARSRFKHSKEIVPINLKSLAIASVALVVPLFCIILWQIHVELVFPDGGESKHALSVENYSNTFAAKSGEDISSISQVFLERTLNLYNNAPVRNIILLNILTIVVIIIQRVTKQKSQVLLVTLILADIIFVIYCIGLYFMYLVSMPTSESMTLAGYTRYLKTITMYLEYLVVLQLVLLLHSASSLDKIIMYSISCTVCVMLLMVGGSAEVKNVFIKSESYENRVLRRQQVVKSITVREQNASYAIYAPNSQNEISYLSWMLKYYIWTNKITVITNIENKSNDEVLAQIQKSDYLVIIDEDERIIDFIEDYVSKESYMGTYSTSDQLVAK